MVATASKLGLQDGVVLSNVTCELVQQSELLPELNLRSLEFHTRMADQYDAVNAFMQTLQA